MSAFPSSHYSKEFTEAVHSDATVARCMKQRMSLEECICMLVAEKKFAMRRAMDFELIAPKKYEMPGGRVMIWRCPDDLVPVTKILP